MRIKTSELKERALDWAVWMAMGEIVEPSLDGGYDGVGNYYEPWSPSTKWGQGGPIIDREDITVGPWDTSPAMAHMPGPVNSRNPRMVGPTKLIAARRCFVVSRLGDEVDVPEELM